MNGYTRCKEDRSLLSSSSLQSSNTTSDLDDGRGSVPSRNEEEGGEEREGGMSVWCDSDRAIRLLKRSKISTKLRKIVYMGMEL